MRWMCRYNNYNDIIKLVIVIKFNRYMAFMAINYQHSICANRAILYMCVKIFDPFQTYLIIGLSIGSWFDNPII